MARVLVLTALLFGSHGWAIQSPPPQVSTCTQGTDGQGSSELRVAQPMRVAEGTIEVIELFSYGCRECAALQPHLNRWLAEKPDYVELVRVPVTWRHAAAYARLYYTLVALNRTDLHQVVFDAIFRQARLLDAADGREAFLQQLEFAREHGISEADFTDAYYSSFVQGYLDEAQEISRAYCNPDVPAFIVNGRLVSDADRTDGTEKLIERVKDLVAQEWARSPDHPLARTGPASPVSQ